MRRIATSIRLRLTLATLLPLVAAIAVCWVVGISIITTRFMAQAQQTVEADLTSAGELLQAELSRLTDIVRLTGQSPELQSFLAGQKGVSPESPLRLAMRNERLSFISLADRYGFVRYRAANPGAGEGQRLTDKLVSDALAGAPSSSIILMSADKALQENSQLAGQLTVPIRPTPRSRTYTRQTEERGLFLMAAAPVLSSNGTVTGAVYGGMLLNNDNRLAERITRIIFHHGDQVFRNSGSATIFLDDIRIATTVPGDNGKPAIGSMMSSEVYSVVSRGERWTGAAFVLDERSFTAYEPLRDNRGSVVGALYVGMPERPYLQLKSRINLIFSAVLLFVTLVGIGLSAWMGNSMSRPIKALEEGARRIAAGEELPDIHVDSRDEIGALAREFNTMKHNLAQRDEENQVLNRTLEEKVVERTVQLEDKNRLLLETQKQLAQAERLAGIGLLASGVAHEINNPLAIIRGNAELIEVSSGSGAQEETAIIMQQVGRIERIVRNLLAFSRGSSRQLTTFPLDRLLDGILDQIGHQLSTEGIRVERLYRDTGIALEADEGQVRQVFTNLIVNGIQAMAGDGTLTVSAERDGTACRVLIADTGPGIGDETREKLFTPFFTTKPHGTGLGLAVSYGLVKDHGGEIVAGTAEGGGAVFTVLLPLPAALQTAACA